MPRRRRRVAPAPLADGDRDRIANITSPYIAATVNRPQREIARMAEAVAADPWADVPARMAAVNHLHRRRHRLPARPADVETVRAAYARRVCEIEALVATYARAAAP